jgi:hypothetical protein
MRSNASRAVTSSVVLGALLLAGCATPVAPFATGFEEAALEERAPAGWRAEGGDAAWSVARDESAPSEPQVVLGRSGGEAANGHALLFDEAEGRDVVLAVRVKPLGGGESQGCGLVYRYRGPADFDYVRWDARAKNVRAYQVRGGARTWIGDAALALDAGWRRLEARVDGRRVSVTVDGRLALTAVDDAAVEGGKVGLWLAAGASAAFDDFEVLAPTDVR